MEKKACIRVKGKVQGVYFRASARDKARELEIKGFAENLESGDVYIEAEGTEENLKSFIDWCRTGPPEAEVNEINIEYRDRTGFTSFQIRF